MNTAAPYPRQRTPPGSARLIPGVVPALLLLALSPCLTAAAEPSPTSSHATRDTGAASTEAGIAPLVGTWTLSAADDLRPDGTRVPAYGDHPEGLLMIDRTGQYSLQIYRTERPRFASGDKRRGTPQEYEAAVIGMSAHIGHCALDPSTGIVTFSIDRASYPNWDATVQKRHYTLEGDVLSYQVPAGAGANIPISVWKRVR